MGESRSAVFLITPLTIDSFIHVPLINVFSNPSPYLF